MWVRVGAAHGRALVLEDLHVPQLLLGGDDFAVRVGRDLSQCPGRGVLERVGRRKVVGVDACPGVDYRHDLGGAHVRESGVVLGGEGEHVAPARGGLRLEEEGGDVIFVVSGGSLRRMVFLLFFLHGAVVVDEGECVFVVRVGVALGALVAGAEVALRIVLRKLVEGWSLLLSPKGSLLTHISNQYFLPVAC